MENLTEYFKLQKAIFDYFGYVEDWRVIPLSDEREMLWRIRGGEGYGGSVQFAMTQDEMDSDGDYYEDEIYTSRYLDKWVYRGKDFTMICCDPGVDGNIFLRVFSNDKEIAE